MHKHITLRITSTVHAHSAYRVVPPAVMLYVTIPKSRKTASPGDVTLQLVNCDQSVLSYSRHMQAQIATSAIVHYHRHLIVIAN